MRHFFTWQAICLTLLFLSSCGNSESAERIAPGCSDGRAVKCSALFRARSPLHDYEAVTRIDSYGGGFGTGYDSADVYISRVESKEATLLLSIEDNADDLSIKDFKIGWASPNQLVIRYGHGDITFQVVKFAGKSITTLHDTTLDKAARS